MFATAASTARVTEFTSKKLVRGRPDLNRHRPSGPTDFKSVVRMRKLLLYNGSFRYDRLIALTKVLIGRRFPYRAAAGSVVARPATPSVTFHKPKSPSRVQFNLHFLCNTLNVIPYETLHLSPAHRVAVRRVLTACGGKDISSRLQWRIAERLRYDGR